MRKTSISCSTGVTGYLRGHVLSDLLDHSINQDGVSIECRKYEKAKQITDRDVETQYAAYDC